MLPFLDGYNGNHQLFIDLEDAIKIALTTGGAVYYYVYMPFGLKNAGASFQRAMTRVFANQIDRNLEVYMDDIVVKSMAFSVYVEHLKETFANLRLHNMRLNPEKCVFGLGEDKFLRYQILRKFISMNLQFIHTSIVCIYHSSISKSAFTFSYH